MIAQFPDRAAPVRAGGYFPAETGYFRGNARTGRFFNGTDKQLSQCWGGRSKFCGLILL